jgi:arsenical pump membrane protein
VVAFTAAAIALAADSAHARDAADQSWRAFVLVTGLLLVGVVAADDGLFGWLASKLDAVPGGGRALFLAGLVVVAITTAFLNLDTAVVFLTPVMIAAARRRDVDEQPFLYGTIFMVNAASLFLPGSNLTNLIVIGHEQVSGSEFARRMFPAAIGAVIGTGLAIWLLQRARLGAGTLAATHAPRPGWLGLAATAAVVVLLLASSNPAIPVLVVGIVATTLLWQRGRLSRGDLLHAVNPLALAAIFCVTVALGTLARSWAAPSDLMASAARVPTAIIGAVAAVLVNNLPAAALLSAGPVHHGRALLIGLNVGPNLAVTGSLSAFLWLQTARASGARPSIRSFSKLGVVVAPAGMIGALVAIYLLAPGRI